MAEQSTLSRNDASLVNQKTSENAPATAPATTPAPVETPAAPPAAKKRNPIGLAVLAVALIAGGFYGFNRYQWSQVHVETDDAFITGNLINVSPLISGTLKELTVSEGDTVTKGQVIARLQDDAEQAAVRQATAAYQSALSQLPQAQASYLYQKAATEAEIAKAQSGIETQAARNRAAGAQVSLTSRSSQSQIAQAQSQLKAVQAQASQTQANVKTAEANLQKYQQAVKTAEQGVRLLQARVQSAQADVDKVSKDEVRYRRLLTQEAVTQQQYDVVGAQLASVQANLAALQEQIRQAQSQVAQARDDVSQAEAQRLAAVQAVQVARQNEQVAQAGINLARANQTQVGVQQANQQVTATQGSEVQADLATALAGKSQVDLRRQQIKTAEAAVRQAKAALNTAQVQESRTTITAPEDGTVVRKASNIGASLSPGQTIFTMTQGSKVFITANFKETQVGRVRVGQPVEVKVDAFPGKHFVAVIGAINAATGASTSLLPPDNATGNFTKVVQRIPVKIALIPGKEANEATAEDIALLRQGMSVVVEVTTKDTTAHPERVPSAYDKIAAH